MNLRRIDLQPNGRAEQQLDLESLKSERIIPKMVVTKIAGIITGRTMRKKVAYRWRRKYA